MSLARVPHATTVSALVLLTDEVHDYRALCDVLGKRLPDVGVAWDVGGVDFRLSVRVDGVDVVSTDGASLEHAARKALDAFRAWETDSEPEIEARLKASARRPR